MVLDRKMAVLKMRDKTVEYKKFDAEKEQEFVGEKAIASSPWVKKARLSAGHKHRFFCRDMAELEEFKREPTVTDPLGVNGDAADVSRHLAP